MADSKTSSPASAEKVGYCRPPTGSRFRKGQSGNPAGRRKGSRNRPSPPIAEDQLGALIREEAYRLVDVNENGEEVRMPVARAVIRSLVVAAAKGDPRAQAVFLRMVSASEANAAVQEQMHDEAQDLMAQEPHEITIKIIDPAPPA